MRLSARLSTFAAALTVAAALFCVPAAAQVVQCGPAGVPPYTTWQSTWDTWQYDANHVVLGTVGGFSPYRLTVINHEGVTQTIDLKPGTEIFPTGSTPGAGEHVAVVGYWSQGTFIANRVIVRP